VVLAPAGALALKVAGSQDVRRSKEEWKDLAGMAATPPGGTRRSHGDSEIQASNYSKGAKKGAEKGRSVENWARIWRTLVEGSPRPLHRWYFVIPEGVSYKRLPHFQPLSSPLTERGGSEGLFFSTKVEWTCNGARTQMNRSTPLRLLQLCRAYHGLFPSTTHRRTQEKPYIAVR
jgi:hypothetical protein